MFSRPFLGARLNLPAPLTRNWPRTCGIWVHEIRLVLEPGPRLAAGWGGLLRVLRRRGAGVAAGLSLAFTVYCTRPTPVPTRRSAAPSPLPSGAKPYEEVGESSWYGGNGDGFAGRPTASGERFDPEALTCAHRTLPLGSSVEVENLNTGRRAILRVNDRGPFARGRVLDVSRRAAQELGFLAAGHTQVRLRSVDAQGRPAPLDPDLDERNPYTIQVAALTDPANIQRLTRELEEAFGPVTLQEVLAGDGRPVKRVRVGSYVRLSEAQKALDQIQRRLRNRGVEPFITRRR